MAHFIKLDVNIMNDTKIKIIRKMPEGAKIFELWLGILCLGMKSGKLGVLEIGDGIYFNDEMLSAELDIDLQVVRMGLNIFTKLKMIEVLDNNSIYITNFEKHQNTEKITLAREQTRKRVQKHREKKLLQLSNSDVTRYKQVTNENVTPTEIELELELEQEKEKDIYITIFSRWNECKIIVHKKLSNNMKKYIDKLIKDFELEEITKGIENYSDIYKSEKTWFNHKWTLEEFLSREKGIRVFIYKSINDYLVKDNFKQPKKSRFSYENEQPQQQEITIG